MNTKVIENRSASTLMGMALLIVLGLASFAGTAYGATLYTDMAVGSTGTEVTELQRFLASDSSIYPEGLVTGYYGLLTRAAVIRYQAANNIAQVGVVGPITRSSINFQMNAGGSVSGDVNAPIISNDTVTTGTNSASISWATSEPATGRVYYSRTWPFFYAASLSASNSTYVTSRTVNISGLTPNSVYFYAKESVDNSGNVMWTTKKTFSTNQ